MQENVKFLVRASYLEIYNENVRDLLGNDHTAKLDLKEHPDKGVYVRGLSEHVVHSSMVRLSLRWPCNAMPHAADAEASVSPWAHGCPAGRRSAVLRRS